MRPIILLIILILHLQFNISGQADEYIMKAVAFEQVSRFLEWPENTIIDDSKPFIIGVLGDNPFGESLEETYAKHKIKNKDVNILYFNEIEEVNKCHILFISNSKKGDIKKVVDYVNEKPILTVGDTKGYAESGVLVNFYLLDNKIRFEINEKKMADVGFSVSYMLLKVAKIINPITG